jgi:hypothetical protein
MGVREELYLYSGFQQTMKSRSKIPNNWINWGEGSEGEGIQTHNRLHSSLL